MHSENFIRLERKNSLQHFPRFSNTIKQGQTVHKLKIATFWDIYRVNKKKWD